jgi:hypothetical protein
MIKNWKLFWDAVALHHKSGMKIRFNDAFIPAYNTSLYDFHKAFEAHAKRQSFIYIIVAINSIAFIILPFVMIAIARKRRKRMLLLPDLDIEEDDPPMDHDEPHPIMIASLES